MSEVYNMEGVSQKLGISIRTLRGYVRTGRIKAKLIGRSYFITEEELTRFLEPSEKDPGTLGPDFLTVTQYSKESGIPKEKVRQWLRDGILEGAKDRGNWLVDPKMRKWWKEINTAIHPNKKTS
jgi:predicted site-specific integrase-resolvase